MLFHLVSAMQPRMLVAFDTELRPMQASVRVGQVGRHVLHTVCEVGRHMLQMVSVNKSVI